MKRARLWADLLLLTLCLFAPRGHGAEGTIGKHGLPMLSLESKERIHPVNRVPFVLRLGSSTNAPSTNNQFTGTIRIHGASSQMYPKKSYSIALDKPVALLGMRESSHWVINAAAVDRSLMRHKLSYDLFRSLSRPGAPRFASASQFVEVNLNGRYLGVYLLMERVDRALLQLTRLDTNATDHACIYKAVDHAAFHSPGHDGYEQREPDPLIKEFWKPLDDLNRFVRSARDDAFFDARKGIGARIDIDNTIDFHLLILLTSNMDGHDKNLIIARDAPATKGSPPRFFFVPWDYDATFGRMWNGSPFPPSVWLSNFLFDRLLSDPAYRKKFAARWKALRDSDFSLPTINRMIDENVAAMGEAAETNRQRWPGASVQEDVTAMKRWLVRHWKWLDSEIAHRCE